MSALQAGTARGRAHRGPRTRHRATPAPGGGTDTRPDGAGPRADGATRADRAARPNRRRPRNP